MLPKSRSLSSFVTSLLGLQTRGLISASRASRRVAFRKELRLETLEGRSMLAAIPLTNVAYTQNFDTLASTGTGTGGELTGALDGWYSSETGSANNSTYTAGTGSANTGDTYSFGSASSTERAFGGLRSGSLEGYEVDR
ncbi:MAG: hypothetical protein SFV81_25085 [Pirellulaceae bacterium]|nr:hypothetical protein [Pirellulaceae bacterium]